MTFKNTFLFFLVLSTIQTYAQLTIKQEVENPSYAINDGAIILTIEGGQAPYQYYWSHQTTPLHSNKAVGLTEGLAYKVVITDANGESSSKEVRVPYNSIPEMLNSFMVPAVEKMGSILFWDPFTFFGIYDPVLSVKDKKVPVPNWNPSVTSNFTLKKWLKNEGNHVNKGDIIAIISENNNKNIEVEANANGVLKHLAKEGEVFYDADDKSHVIQVGAHNLAEIKYDTPEILKHPNGDPVTRKIPFIVVWLVVAALFFTLRLGFINIRGFKHAVDVARGKFDEPDAPGKTTHFQALTTAVSGTVGLGNIAGVAVAVSLGGAGATFLFVIAGLLGMSSKFVECTLGVKYREIKNDGRVFGGPMNYLRYGLERRNKKTLGKILAYSFAILTILGCFGAGNMFQINQAFEQLSGQFTSLQGSGFWFGILSALLIGAVIIGGIKSIANVTSRVVPFMTILYVVACLIVIGMNIHNVGHAFSVIMEGAFSPDAMKGGVIGVIIVGFQRAVFSNEAGVGSAAIAHSTAKTNRPISEGFVSLLEPFLDTIIVCTLTALVIIFTGRHEVTGISGSTLTSSAFGSVFSWMPYVLVVAIFLFAVSTIISWSYYGMRAWTFIFGKSVRSEMIFKLIYLCFIVLGASIGLGAVLDFSDMMLLAMAVPNVIGLYILSGEVSQDLKSYLTKLKNKMF